MLTLSELLIGDHRLETFEQLLDAVRERARAGEIFIEMDVRPPFPDTPGDWEQRIEAAFTSAEF